MQLGEEERYFLGEGTGHKRDTLCHPRFDVDGSDTANQMRDGSEVEGVAQAQGEDSLGWQWQGACTPSEGGQEPLESTTWSGRAGSDTVRWSALGKTSWGMNGV